MLPRLKSYFLSIFILAISLDALSEINPHEFIDGKAQEMVNVLKKNNELFYSDKDAYENKIKVIFTPHLIPMFRGILSTIYLETKRKYNAKKVHSILKKYHKNNYFVKIAKLNTSINTGDVMNTNFCKISVCEDRKNNRIIILSVIDNLIKGGSGQAVQSMNVAFNINETVGLI